MYNTKSPVMKIADTAPFDIYIPFFTDYGFKVTFGNEHNHLFLKRALQALIQSLVPIETIWFDKNTIEGQTLESRGGVLDIYCRDSTGNIFIVEMQLGKFPHILQRLKFYAYHKLDMEIRKEISCLRDYLKSIVSVFWGLIF